MLLQEQKSMETTVCVFVDNLERGDVFQYNGKQYFAYNVLPDWHVPCRRYHVQIGEDKRNHNHWLLLNVTEVVVVHQEDR